MERIGKTALERFADRKVWLFYGEMGAGKTTFIKVLLKLLKTRDPGSSPSFSLVNEYCSPEAGPVFHFDFYRIQHEGEALDIGYEDYFYSGAYCFVEWPEKIPNLLPEGSLKIQISRHLDRCAICFEA